MKRSRLLLDCVVLLGMLVCVSPLSAQSIQQSGNVTPTHFGSWTTNGVMQDAGTAAQPAASTGGVSPGPWCVNSGPVTGSYQAFCMNVTSTGGILSVQNLGGASPGGISFNINGSPAGIPAVVVPTTGGDAACFNNTTGTLIDCGVPNFKPGIDVFLLVGDSQDVGQGNSAQSPIPPATAFMYCAPGTVSPGSGVQSLTDPACSAVSTSPNWNANTGSMWPATSIAYGRRVGLVQTGVSGSTQSSAADFGLGNGNWQATTAGSNNANALAALNAAMTAYTTAGYAPTFRGIIYVLGNNDAIQIDNSVITVGQYTSALTAFVTYWRTVSIGGTTYPRMQLWLPIIGTNVTGGVSDTGYSQVRAAQIAFAAADGDVSVPFTNLYSMAARGYIQANSVHLNQAGLNIMGTAIGAALIPAISANIPYQLFSANAGIGGAAPAGTVLQGIGADGVQVYSLLDAYASNPTMQLRRADTTLQAPSAVRNDEIIGVFGVQSYGASGFGASNQGALLFLATQDHTDAAKGTQACIYTTANGAAMPTCNLTIGQNGLISAGALTLSGQLAATAMTQTSAAQSGTVCYSTSTGALTYDATLGCLTSLEELKDIHGPITDALAEVNALRPFWFSPIRRPAGSDIAEQPGFGAHQVEAVDRRLVGYGPDGQLRGVRYMEMSALLAAAIQELKVDNDNLRYEMEILKRKVR